MALWSRAKRYRSRLLTYAMAFGTVFITVSLVKYPKEAFDSAITGLNLWWNVVFPSLLPFFILSEILMGLGIVHFIGVLLEPLMRPLFNVPGIGAFALSMGLASGYPMDAVITSRFRKNKLCSAVEAERLLSFTNTADPLFMFGAVAVGMFGMPQLGPTIALAHYLSSFLVGFLFRYHGTNQDKSVTDAAKPNGNILIRAFHALYQARQEDKRSLGQLLGDSVKSSMNTILLIGGFIIVFSVILQIVSSIGATAFLNTGFVFILQTLGFNTNLAPALVTGMFELDIGAMAASQADAALVERVAIAGAVIAWSGLSVHGQVASIVIESGIRMTPYMVGRLLHAVLAAGITMLLMNYSSTVANYFTVPVSLVPAAENSIFFLQYRLEQFFQQFMLLTGLLLVSSITFYLLRQIYFLVRR